MLLGPITVHTIDLNGTEKGVANHAPRHHCSGWLRGCRDYIALGKGLKEAGHAVRLVTHENFETLVASHGLEFWPVAGSEQDIVQGADLVPEARARAQQRAVILSGWSGLQVAGLPSSVVIPLFADQRFWDWRVAEWGVGPAPIPRRRLTAEQLARAIESAVGDPIMRRRAANLGTESRAEDGIARAVAVVRQIEK